MAQIQSKNSRAKLVLIFCLIVVLSPSISFAGTYYIASSGSDSNDGTTKTTPWLYAPGMQGCSGNCSSYTPAAGDNFILRGGDTWTFTVGSGWGINWSGSSENPIYFGVDQTWYSGSSWARPILSGGGAPLSTWNCILGLGANYVTIDNFEFTGGSWTAGSSNGNMYINTNESRNFIIENCYFHGWVTPNGTDYGTEINLGGGLGGVIENCTIDGFDTAQVEADPNCTGACLGSTYAIYGYNATVHHCTIRHTASGLVGSAVSFHDNLIEYLRYSTSSTMHQDAFMSVTDYPGTLVYNNIIRHVPTSIAIIIAPAAGNPPSYVFNNVIYDTTGGSPNIFDIFDANSNPGGTVYVYNNTIQGGPAASANEPCILMQSPSGSTTAIVENNHCISNVGFIAQSGGTLTQNTNLTQTLSVANGQGYTAANNFAPTGASGSTVGAGTNLTIAGITGLNSDIVATPRPPNSVPLPPWDIGAYQYATGGLKPPTAVYLLPPSQ